MRAYNKEELATVIKLRSEGLTYKEIIKVLNLDTTPNALRKQIHRYGGEALLEDDSVLAEVKLLKKAERVNRELNNQKRVNKALIKDQITREEMLDAIKTSVSNLKINKVKRLSAPKSAQKKTKMTVEALLSDLQIGKVMRDYNTEIAIKRLKEYTRALLFKIKQQELNGYHVERIVLSCLGDLIENDEKHHNSQRGTDTSNPEQIYNVIELLINELILPLTQNTHAKIDFVGVTGNHESAVGGLNMVSPGKTHYSWTIYKTLELLCNKMGLEDTVSFLIPEGCHATYEIYGKAILVEHGVGVGATEMKMKEQVTKRSNQIKKFISAYRMGDKHHIARFNNDQYVINGAFFGNDTEGVEYSGIAGYNSTASQLILFHVNRKEDDPRSTVYDTFVIQLQHIK